MTDNWKAPPAVHEWRVFLIVIALLAAPALRLALATQQRARERPLALGAAFSAQGQTRVTLSRWALRKKCARARIHAFASFWTVLPSQQSHRSWTICKC